MAYNLTKAQIKNFNKTYKTDIDLNKILSEAQEKNSFNAALQSAFREAYKKVVMRDLSNKKNDTLHSKRLLDNFKMLVVDNIIFDTPKSRQGDLSMDMGLKSKEEEFAIMSEVLDSVPSNEVDLIEERYLNGDIRIRDMVRFANDTVLDNRSATIMASYAEALKKVNEGRSFWWRVFHPFRNNAEQRDSKKIEDLIKERGSETMLRGGRSAALNKLSMLDAVKNETREFIVEGKDDLAAQYSNIFNNAPKATHDNDLKYIIKEYDLETGSVHEVYNGLNKNDDQKEPVHIPNMNESFLSENPHDDKIVEPPIKDDFNLNK